MVIVFNVHKGDALSSHNFFFMCPLLLPNDGLSNRLKHVIEMYREVTTFLIVPVFSEHKN